jgi:hypothetical protein
VTRTSQPRTSRTEVPEHYRPQDYVITATPRPVPATKCDLVRRYMLKNPDCAQKACPTASRITISLLSDRLQRAEKTQCDIDPFSAWILTHFPSVISFPKCYTSFNHPESNLSNSEVPSHALD